MARIMVEFEIVGIDWDPTELIVLMRGVNKEMTNIINEGNIVKLIFSEGFHETYDTNFVTNSFLDVMENNVAIINKWCSKYLLEIKTKIVAEAVLSLMPSFSINNRMLKFLNLSNSTIAFELSILTKKMNNLR